MNKITRKAVAFLMLSFPFSSWAESEIEAWYTSKGNEYLVRDSVHGNLHALLSISKGGEPFVYIIMFDKDCKESSGNIFSHNPLYINGTLTQYQQYCDGERRYFMPATEAGRAHLIQEFKIKNFVEIETHDKSFKNIYSAKGFTSHLNKLTLRGKGI
ncbi:hypothetical protein [Pseudomonas saudiphocaensis]|uniref:hypothetical protein n=1 Tax=Pseudomonas saudiphocaensis TaxID=1499686 RepID=UPI00187D4390|nr:hypothetical protein [Pseudomonas saudiphocaensis]MBE7927632.1 hypothetical protein [Pseudomonas saudiphocaensis]